MEIVASCWLLTSLFEFAVSQNAKDLSNTTHSRKVNTQSVVNTKASKWGSSNHIEETYQFWNSDLSLLYVNLLLCGLLQAARQWSESTDVVKWHAWNTSQVSWRQSCNSTYTVLQFHLHSLAIQLTQPCNSTYIALQFHLHSLAIPLTQPCNSTYTAFQFHLYSLAILLTQPCNSSYTALQFHLHSLAILLTQPLNFLCLTVTNFYVNKSLFLRSVIQPLTCHYTDRAITRAQVSGKR